MHQGTDILLHRSYFCCNVRIPVSVTTHPRTKPDWCAG